MIQQLQRKIILCLRYCRKVENRTELLMTEVIIHQHANKQRKKITNRVYVSCVCQSYLKRLAASLSETENLSPIPAQHIEGTWHQTTRVWVFFNFQFKRLKRLRPTTKSLHSSRIKESCELNYYWQYNYLQVTCMARAMVSTRALFSSSDSPDNS